MSLMEAYRFLWTLAPIIFGLALAYFLATLFGPAVAGVALILMAFKVFPAVGLNLLVPANLTMALAVILWARIISRQGRVPWLLFPGSLVLITMHLIGVIYAAMAGVMALYLASKEDRRRLWIAELAVAALIVVRLMIPHFITRPLFTAPPPLLPQGGGHPLINLAVGALENLSQIVTYNLHLVDGLWGAPALFAGALVLGLVTLEAPTRRVVWKILLIYGVFLGGLVFYVSYHPADVFLRLWMPLVALLFGLVAQGICYTLDLSVAWWQEGKGTHSTEGRLDLKQLWPILLLAVLLSYAGEMILRGTVQVKTMASHLRNQQPLALYPAQPEMLLARARPGDRVLYTSLIPMDYYLIYGALRLGAVYYHPALRNTQIYSNWLTGPDIRFAVAFQPTVYHPSFEGLDEPQWWTSAPDFSFSPLRAARKPGPLAREGKIPASRYRWLDLKVKAGDFPKTLHLNIENPGGPAVLEVVPLNRAGEPLDQYRQVLQVPARWSGRLPVELAAMPSDASLRLVFPREKDLIQLGGLTFGKDRLHWPWAQKALLTFQPRHDCTGPVTVSFDPAALLPEPLQGNQITVLNDRGSSVLLELKR